MQREDRFCSVTTGRAFTAAEERPGSNGDVAIVSYNYWKKTGSDPELLGKTLRINSRILTVVDQLYQSLLGIQ